VGIRKNPDDIARKWKISKRYEPAMKKDQVQALRNRWNQALDRARNWDAES
jgi:glycerol kinase